MAAKIRAAREDEADSVLSTYDWLFEEPGYRPSQWDAERARDALVEAIRMPGSRVFVADDGGELVGICSAYVDLNSVRYGYRCWVEDLAVHPERRSEGIGGRLLDAAREWAREHGATHLELDTGVARSDAQRFYERQGEANKGISYSWRL